MDRRELVSTERIERFKNNQRNNGHFGRNYRLFSEEYFEGITNAANIIQAVKNDLPHDFRPKRILDLGCSAGQSTHAVAKIWPKAQITGLDIEVAAIEAAEDINSQLDSDIEFIVASGSEMPFDNGHFDLIICHTVIEHVSSVETTISEAWRCLEIGGYLSLEAPNYAFPYEPHVKVYFSRHLGKKLLKLQLNLLGVDGAQFVDHLNFVTAKGLRKQLNRAGFTDVNNRYYRKLLKLSDGELTVSDRWRYLLPILKIPFLKAVLINFAPSLMFLAKK